MSTSAHELVYFDAPGRAEAARITFSAAAIPLKDTRLDFATFGAAKKAGKYPLGLPMLKINDTTEYLQSLAILRYAGKIAQVAGGDAAKLYPAHAVKALAIDQALDMIQDASAKCPQHADNDTKKKLREEYAEGKFKMYCQQLSSLVEKSGGPFFTGTDMTIADLHCVFLLYDGIASGSWDYFPVVSNSLPTVCTLLEWSGVYVGFDTYTDIIDLTE
jgi:glutathione S-transferase